MNREQLSNEAAKQYSALRCNEAILEEWSEKTFAIGAHRSAMEVIRLMNRRDREIKYRKSMLVAGNAAARSFYQANHAELYEMAREEMEAEGIPFNFADHREETVYRFGEEIADMEQESPLNALGAKVLQLGEKHQGFAEAALA